MSKAERRRLSKFSYGVIVVSFAIAGAAAASLATSCRQGGVRPDNFVDAVVDCGPRLPAAVAATEQIVQCLSGGAQLACLADLANAISATRDQVLCVVGDLSRTQSSAIGTTRLLTDTPTPKLAADFLAANRVTLRDQ